MVSTSYLQGLGLGAGLIMAIGAQNAHVLRMGLRREHVALTVAACVAVDVLLIVVGVAGLGALIEGSPWALRAARWGGAAFLLAYGLRAWHQAWRGGQLAVQPPQGARGSWRGALLTVLALSLLNPHVYLDTVVLLGSVGAQQPAAQRPGFAAGAATASLLWFVALGFGARVLAPLFARPVAWRVLDVLVGMVMVSLAVALVA
ncbi:LysE/ArgO family amino acid transporter [Ideonella sp. BN130291]|uniref:LysE/ArgO family amino acid transporter n=1 Tax=Ideonella sp. BN130291 TaxID=3112940 RepID=UPI002E269994|nr:LysE/ArgO family amino acid transporter [Ideonella sp. BN130291]